MEQKSQLLWIFAIIIALLLGISGGWWYGNRTGFEKGKIAAQTEAAKAAAEAANPFKQANSNPLNKVITNPLESVKLNPFK